MCRHFKLWLFKLRQRTFMLLQSQCLIINAILWTSRGRCYLFSADLHRWSDRPLQHELRFLATFLWSQKGHLDISNYQRANRYSRFLISFWPILNLMQHNHTLNIGGLWDTLAYSNANKSLLNCPFTLQIQEMCNKFESSWNMTH